MVMKEMQDLYQIDGYEGAWKLVNSSVNQEGDLIGVFQEATVGVYLELVICPFDVIYNQTIKWDLK